MSEASLHALLVEELKVVRKFGLHRLAEHVHELPTLSRVALDIYGVGTADRLEKLFHEAWNKRAEGAQATAVGSILGLEIGRRGAHPAVLREMAATRLGHASVDTFRKKPECQAIAYFADVIERYCVNYQPEVTNDEYRIHTALNAVMALTLTEYTEFAARLARRFAAYEANHRLMPCRLRANRSSPARATAHQIVPLQTVEGSS